MRRILIEILMILVSGAVWSCTTVAGGSDDPKGQMKTLMTEIVALTRNKSCKQVAECRTAALGVKSCGGPKRYIVYSATYVNETDLLVRASTYNNLDRQVSQDSVGTCEILLPPQLACQRTVCVALPAQRSQKPQ